MKTPTPFERYGTNVPGADANLHLHLLAAGTDVSWLAHVYLGDWRAWRDICDRNAIVDVRMVEPGTLLLIPPDQPELGAFEST